MEAAVPLDLIGRPENQSADAPPFPGMDPWLEHPAIWLDVHNSLITAIRDELVPRIAPKYYAGIEQRVYALEPGEPVLVGRPDIAVGRAMAVDLPSEPDDAEESAAVGVLDVEVSIDDKVEEWFLEVHDVETGTLVTALEILSPFNKCHAPGAQGIHRQEAVGLAVTDEPRRDRLAPRRRADAFAPQGDSHRLSDPRQPRSDAPAGQVIHLQRAPADSRIPDSPPAARR